MSSTDRYGADVLARDPHPRRAVREVEAEPGLVVECATSGWCGAVVGYDRGPEGPAVVLEDRHGRRRAFTLHPAAFLLDGEPVTLVRPTGPATPAGPRRSASGGVVVPGERARVARASRIWVEGVHDAALVEQVWGDDLRHVGVVVEPLGGVDDLPAAVASFRPGPGRRLGVLVDHLVAGSKEARLAADTVARFPAHVLVLGHPYIDVWQAVRPQAAGIERWPDVPRGTPWKEGVCRALGWGDDTALAWRRLLGRVRTYADLEPALLARVEELVDFVTGDEGATG